jgi:hypothetical protein
MMVLKNMKKTKFSTGRRAGSFALVILIAVFAILGTASTSHAVSVSQSGVLFLKISPGARAGGMGEAFVAVADDASATWWNPAGLAYVRNNEVTLMHSNWLPQFKFNDLYYDFVSYVHQVDDWGTFGGNIIFLNLGESIRTDETGNELGTFNSYEMALTGSYGSIISPTMSLGVSMRFIFSHLSDSGAGAEKGSGEATSVGVDIGWLWQTPLDKLSLGANLTNMGPEIAYIDRAQADPLPTNLKFGLAYKLVDSPYNTLTFLADVDKELVRLDEDGDPDPFYLALVTAWSDGALMKTLIYHTGIEYWYSDLIALRAGYWNDELGKVKPITFGASLKYSLYKFDFSYVSAGEGHPLQDTMRFSLSVGF